MSRLAKQLERALTSLGELQARSALLGGLAMAVRTEPRFTRDVDLAVAVADDAEAEGLVGALLRSGYGLEATVEQVATGRLATARLVPPGEGEDGIVIDLLFASSGIEPEIVGEAEELEVFPGVICPVARPGHLLALKLLARDDDSRPQDIIDLRALLVAGIDQTERERARQAVSLISARGCARGRDLEKLLSELLAATERPGGAP